MSEDSEEERQCPSTPDRQPSLAVRDKNGNFTYGQNVVHMRSPDNAVEI